MTRDVDVINEALDLPDDADFDSRVAACAAAFDALRRLFGDDNDRLMRLADLVEDVAAFGPSREEEP